MSEPGSDKNDSNVDYLINRLRQKLSDEARQPRFIATRYGEGYVWIAEAPLDLDKTANADIMVGSFADSNSSWTLRPRRPSHASCQPR